MNTKLFQLEKSFKNFLTAFILVLSVGISLGLIYLNYTTDYSTEQATTMIQGSKQQIVDEELDIPDYYPKPISELLITTHNHIIGFAFIFFLMGGLFYFNSVIEGFWKKFLIIEPLVSTLITFGSLWGIRYIGAEFAIVAAISSTLLYISFFLMASVMIYELKFKKIM